MKSIYIHIPFCHKICSYCDFCKMIYNKNMSDKYIDSLIDEFYSYDINNKIKTIYVGGGTPSSLNNNQLEKLFSITNKIDLEDNYEFSFEMNPEDINEDILKLLKKNKVNRISIGIETINDKFYDLLNRYNDKNDLIKKINLVKKYFNNINIDLMYAFKDENINDLDNDLNFFLNLNIPHISIYSLIIEDNTVLGIKNTKPIEEELDSDMYYHIIKKLKDNNYNHYEISNFSKEGYESLHNTTYWNNEEYIGLGLGASGYLKNIRYTNTRNLNKYIEENYILEEEILDENSKMEYEMILGLRKTKGVNKDEFFNKYHLNINEKFDIINLEDKNLLEDKNGYIYIPEDKLYISNNILVNFLGGQDE